MQRVPVPTRRALSVAAAVVVIGAWVPLVAPLSFFWWIALGVSFLLLIEDYALRPRVGAIRVQREFPEVVHVGRSGSYAVVLTNTGPRSLSLEFEDRLPAGLGGVAAHGRLSLAPDETARVSATFVALERGGHAFPPLGLRVSHQLGLLGYQERHDLGDLARVAPGRPAGETAALLAQTASLEESGAALARRKGMASEFESMREYVIGDELRRIDWKASARRHRPMVREFRSERNAEVVLALDAGRLMGGLVDDVRKLDLAMTPLLDLAAVALRAGERVGLLAFDSAPRVWLPARAGLAQLNTMTNALAELGADAEPTSYVRAVAHLEAKHRKRSMILMFTDFTDEISAQDLYASLASLARRHVLLVVAVSDPHLEAIFCGHRGAERDLFERAVAGQLLAERERTLLRLRRLGVATVDAEPRALTVPLIRRYLGLRSRV